MGCHPEQCEGSGFFARLKPVVLLLGMTEDSPSAVEGVPGLDPYGECPRNRCHIATTVLFKFAVSSSYAGSDASALDGGRIASPMVICSGANL
jgi:hypothetical protein